MEQGDIFDVARSIGRDYIRNMAKVFIGVKDMVDSGTLDLVEGLIKNDILSNKSGGYKWVLEMIIDSVIIECDKEYDAEKVVEKICLKYGM